MLKFFFFLNLSVLDMRFKSQIFNAIGLLVLVKEVRKLNIAFIYVEGMPKCNLKRVYAKAPRF